MPPLIKNNKSESKEDVHLLNEHDQQVTNNNNKINGNNMINNNNSNNSNNNNNNYENETIIKCNHTNENNNNNSNNNSEYNNTINAVGSCQPPHPIDRIVWKNVFIMSYIHLVAFYGLYLSFTSAQWKTVITAFILYICGGIGITAGAHRLWSHKSYKARFPLRIILVILNCIAFQNDIYEWCRDHRVHHKYSETDADPHNALRGFFFSHVGWLLSRKHPMVLAKGKTIDCSDVWSDPIIRFQRKHYLKLTLTCSYILPTLLPYYLWNENFLTSFAVCGAMKYVITLHVTWLVNSAAHMWGNKPYDEHINPAENTWVAIGSVGEGFHNYHHTFPYDYAASEFGVKLNLTTLFIDTFAKIGWAYDRKKVSQDIIQQRKLRTGDGSGSKKNNEQKLHKVTLQNGNGHLNYD